MRGLASLYLAGAFSLASVYLPLSDSPREAAEAFRKAVSWPGWLPLAAISTAVGTLAHFARRLVGRGQ